MSNLYGQSLEDMLAELEAQPAGKEGSDSDENFDDFMKKLDLDKSTSSPSPSQQRPQSVQQPVKQPVQQAQSKPASQPARQNTNVQSGGGDLGGGRLPRNDSYDSVGEKLLVQEGFVRHNNKGKFVNYRNGKATDFRIKGTTSSKVGLLHVITLRSLDDYNNLCPITEVNPKDFIAVILTHRETNKDIQPWFKDNNDGTYDLAFYNDFGGTVRMEIKLCGNPMFDLDIQVDETGDSLWVALGEASCLPDQEYKIDIVTSDGSRPEGVAPFEVQTMGDITDLKLVNNGDGTYFCECVPHSNGHITVQITLHGEPIKNSPLTVQVGEKQKYSMRQTATAAQPSKTQPQSQPQPQQQPQAARQTQAQSSKPQQAQPQQTQQQQRKTANYPTGLDDLLDSYTPNSAKTNNSSVEVTNDDLNALLNELGGY